MATVPFTAEPITLTTTAQQVISCPANQYMTTKKVTVTNTTSSAVTLTVYKVPSGGTAGASNVLYSGITIPQNTVNGGMKELYEAENQVLVAGDTLQALASAGSSLVLNVSGIEQSV